MLIFPIEDSFSLVRLTALVDLLGALVSMSFHFSKASWCHLALSHVLAPSGQSGTSVEFSEF